MTQAGTVSVSVLLWLPMPKLVMKPGCALNGELHTCVVSLATITHQAYLTCRISRPKGVLTCWIKIRGLWKWHIKHTHTKNSDPLSVVAIFCDYYNNPGDCEWHYKPCGADCMKTCRNPTGKCFNLVTAVEGKVDIFWLLIILHFDCFESDWPTDIDIDALWFSV